MAGKKKAAPKAGSVEPIVENHGTAPVDNAGLVFVNRDKFLRASEILALVTGKRIPRDGSEEDRKEKFTGFLAESEIGIKDPGALKFIYEKLGGLVRTPDEQESADQVAEEARKKNRTRKIEADK